MFGDTPEITTSLKSILKNLIHELMIVRTRQNTEAHVHFKNQQRLGYFFEVIKIFQNCNIAGRTVLPMSRK